MRTAYRSIIDFEYRYISNTFWPVTRTKVRMNLADWSGDAQVGDNENEPKHALTSKSIQYDVAKVYVKVVLAAFKMYIAFLPDKELAFSCVVVCGGAALLLLGVHFDQFYEADLPGSLQLPLGLSANGIQTGLDAAVLWVYLSQLVAVIGGPEYLAIGVVAVFPTAYALRRRTGKRSAVAPQAYEPLLDDDP